MEPLSSYKPLSQHNHNLKELEDNGVSQCHFAVPCGYEAPINTHAFHGPLSGTTQVSRYQKGKTNLDFTEARDSEWQWHQLGHMQVCTLLQTDYHAITSHSVFYRPDALPVA